MDMAGMEFLISGAKEFGVCLSEEQAQTLIAFYEEVSRANRSFNLTAISDEREFFVKHIVDSLAAAPLITQNATVCDIGSGAGFPAMPLAVARPDICVTAIDATLKKATFIGSAAETLAVKNIRATAGRAEERTDLFGAFDCVTARAVSQLRILLELAAPLLKTGGTFFAYKTSESELEESKNALKVLNMRHAYTKKFLLPNGDPRVILAFEKVGKTPEKYPRRYGVIKNKPL